jgi:hypothetical protein
MKGASSCKYIRGTSPESLTFFVSKPDKEFPWPVDANELFHSIGACACASNGQILSSRQAPIWSRLKAMTDG